MAEEVLSNGGDPCGRPFSLFFVNQFIDGELQCDLSRHNENPFKSLEILLQRPAYLAMFLKHLHETKGCEATVPLLFLLRVGSYYHLAKNLLDGKDSKRQAQSIIHTFLSQNAPWTMAVDPAKVEAIDAVYRNKEVSVEEAYTIFNPLTLEVGEAISAQLESYQQTLKAEDDDDTLQEDLDRGTEYQVTQKLLGMVVPQSAFTAQDGAYAMLLTSMALALGLDPKSAFLEKLANLQQKGVLGSSTSTMLHKGKGKHQVHIIVGHNFVATHYNSPTFCDFCNGLLWGIGNQGYTCQLCNYNVHKATCNQSITEYCRGEPKDGAASIFRRGSLKPSFSGSFRQGMRPSASRCSVESDVLEDSFKRRLAPLHSACSSTMLADSMSMESGVTIDRSSSLADRATGAVSVNNFNVLRRGVSNATQCSAVDVTAIRAAAATTPKILRAQSMKICNAAEKGRTPTGHGHGREAPQSAGSGTRRSMDSTLIDNTSPQTREGSSVLMSSLASDPDLNVDEDLVPWSIRTSDSLPNMEKKEIKRQDLIHELVHTEQTHVKKLKVLYHVFYTPLLSSEIFAAKLIDALFPGLESLIEFHVELMNGLKTCLDASNHCKANEIGAVLVQFFSGEKGERLRDAASEWVKLRQANVDFVKLYSTKQPKLGQLITQCEADPICTRLKLTDLSSVVMQRFTKYPLLLESILKVTSSSGGEEHDHLNKAIEQARRILEQINQDVMEFENNRTLFELQARIDFKNMDKLTGTLAAYRTLDISSRELIHRGDLKWRQKGKLISVDAILFPDILVLLEHNEDKLRHSLRVRDDFIPIITLKDLLPPREVASDKERRSFLLVWLTSSGSRMYELSANTSDLSCTWRVKISDAIAASKSGLVNVTSMSYSKNIKAYVLRAHVNYARSLSTQETVDSIDTRRHSDQHEREKEEREIDEARLSPKSSSDAVHDLSGMSSVTTMVSRPMDSGAEMSEGTNTSSETERTTSVGGPGSASPLASPVGTASSDLVVMLESCLNQTRQLATLAQDAIKETQARGRSIRSRPNTHHTDSSTSRMFSAIESIRGQLKVSLDLAKRTVVEQRHTSVAIAAAAAAAAAAAPPPPAAAAAAAVVSDSGKDHLRSPSPRTRRNLTTLQVQEEEPPQTTSDEHATHKLASYASTLKKTMSCMQKDDLHSQIKRSWSDTPAYGGARAAAVAKQQQAMTSGLPLVTVPHLSVDSSNLAAQRQLQLDVV